MVERVYPQEYFMRITNDTLLYLGLIILGIVACVALAVIGVEK